eukprot:scaffold16908_cov76-Amphora_coffeaeformis.AAC.1
MLSHESTDDDDDADNDDLNLLKRTSDYDDVGNDDDDDVFVMADEVNPITAHMISGVELAYPPSSPSTAAALVGYRVQQQEQKRHQDDDEPAVSKEARIRQYETIGVDEESSVEEEDQEEPDDDDTSSVEENVQYYQAKDEEEDDDEHIMITTNFASFDTECYPQQQQQQMAQLHIQEPTILPSQPCTTFALAPAKKKKATGSIPLLHPPPAEKLAAWETSRTSKK